MTQSPEESLGVLQAGPTQDLVLNRSTGYYEGIVMVPTLVQVDIEIYKRVFLKAIEDDEVADLTDPGTFSSVDAKLRTPTYWLNKPNAHVTPVAPSLPALPSPIVSSKPIPEEHWSLPGPKPRTKQGIFKAELLERAQHVPPFLWEEQCLTPYPDDLKGRDAKQPIANRRHEERVHLGKLYEEWKQGNFTRDEEGSFTLSMGKEHFTLDEKAAREQRTYEEAERQNVGRKLEVVAASVNGNGFH